MSRYWTIDVLRADILLLEGYWLKRESRGGNPGSFLIRTLWKLWWIYNTGFIYASIFEWIFWYWLVSDAKWENGDWLDWLICGYHQKRWPVQFACFFLPADGYFCKTKKNYPKRVAHQWCENHKLCKSGDNYRMEWYTLKPGNQTAGNNTDDKELG